MAWRGTPRTSAWRTWRTRSWCKAQWLRAGSAGSTLYRAGLEDHVVALVGRSPRIAAFWNSPLGFVFVDGGHTDEHATADYEGWAPHVAQGGLLLIHDVFPDPKDEFTGQAPYRVYLRALESGAFTEVSAHDSLRVLRRTRAGI